MGAIQRVKQLMESGMSEEEAHNQVVQDEEDAQRDYLDAMADYDEGWWSW